MTFELPMVAALSGATKSQLLRWRDMNMLVPEVQKFRPPLYSFRDIVVARSLAFLRSRKSAQSIRKAVANIHDLNLTWDHLSTFKFGTDGQTIFIGTDDDDQAVDVLKRPGQTEIFTFNELAETFENFRGDQVVDLRRPAAHLEVAPDRIGGWPTITGTRIPFDVVAATIDGHDVTIDEVGDLWPGVTPEAARDAIAFDEKVRRLA